MKLMKRWKNRMGIEGRRILVTGASSGIGLALANALARKGANLVLASRRIDILHQVTERIKSEYPDNPAPLALKCDVSNRDSVSNLIRHCLDHLGNIDILINNAGISVYGTAEKTPVDDFHSIMEVNYFGALYCMLHAIPIMKKSGEGLIVNVVSVGAKHGIPYLGAYCASKAALVAFGQSLRAELSNTGISIMNVFPGYTQTSMFENEKKVGGAHRPRIPYAPASKVAEVIVRAIERGNRDLVLSKEGKTLLIIQRLLPSLVDKAMEKIAFQLRDPQEVCNE